MHVGSSVHFVRRLSMRASLLDQSCQQGSIRSNPKGANGKSEGDDFANNNGIRFVVRLEAGEVHLEPAKGSRVLGVYLDRARAEWLIGNQPKYVRLIGTSDNSGRDDLRSENPTHRY